VIPFDIKEEKSVHDIIWKIYLFYLIDKFIPQPGIACNRCFSKISLDEILFIIIIINKMSDKCQLFNGKGTKDRLLAKYPKYKSSIRILYLIQIASSIHDQIDSILDKISSGIFHYPRQLAELLESKADKRINDTDVVHVTLILSLFFEWIEITKKIDLQYYFLGSCIKGGDNFYRLFLLIEEDKWKLLLDEIALIRKIERDILRLTRDLNKGEAPDKKMRSDIYENYISRIYQCVMTIYKCIYMYSYSSTYKD